MNSTANDIADRQPLRGRTALITGATAGIGYETARALACSGARVLVTGRDPANGELAAATLARDCGADSVSFLRADHATVGGSFGPPLLGVLAGILATRMTVPPPGKPRRCSQPSSDSTTRRWSAP